MTHQTRDDLLCEFTTELVKYAAAQAQQVMVHKNEHKGEHEPEFTELDAKNHAQLVVASMTDKFNAILDKNDVKVVDWSRAVETSDGMVFQVEGSGDFGYSEFSIYLFNFKNITAPIDVQEC